MPNHVTHRVTVTGPTEALSEFKAKHVVNTEGERVFDFNTIKPMPAILSETENCRDLEIGYELATGRVPEGASSVLTYEWVNAWGAKTIDELSAYLVANEPENYECYVHAGALAVEAERQTGYLDWYRWSIAKWGTKWNSYRFRMIEDAPDRIVFLFDTAWSPPVPIFKTLTRLYPLLSMDVVAFDELWNYAWTASCVEGRFSEQDHAASEVLYEAVYGCPPDEIDDDEDAQESAFSSRSA